MYRSFRLSICAATLALACSDRGAVRFEGADASVSSQRVSLEELPSTRERVAALRGRFAGAMGAEVGVRFEAGVAGVHAVFPPGQPRAARTATTTLPTGAAGAVHLDDDTTHVAIDFALRGAADVEIAVAAGLALFPRALAGADVVHRVRRDGTEDFVAFERAPAVEELVYDVDVTHVAGLRLVSNTLEFLDAGGAPRLRVAPPWVVDGRGRHDAKLAVQGCSYDADPRGPWGRPVTPAGAASCRVRVSWSGVAYPALVDPAWTATGSMATVRSAHSATLLPSGKVLVAGGSDGSTPLSTAELFDGTSSFAATGSLVMARYGQTATALPSGKVLLSAGVGVGWGELSSAELFDAGTFALTGSMSDARQSHTATLLSSGKVLVTGGYAAGSYLPSAELFDGTGAFTKTGSMSIGRAYHTATRLASGKVLVAGGQSGSIRSTAELFDGTSSFTAAGSMTGPRAYHTATLLPSGKVLIAGGSGATALSSAELFDGVGTFSATGAMSKALNGHTATLLASGKVLIAGGRDIKAAKVSSGAELFDGSAFASISPMTAPHNFPTATLLATGNVLLAGGEDDVAMLSTAEIFALVATGTCVSGSECASGVCEDGNCCVGPCSGTCKTCLAVTGACVSVTGADDPDTCAGSKTCSATGACLLKPGQSTVSASACASGVANDGFCCDGPCTGACRTCAGSGACVAVSAADDLDTCTGTKTCSAAGNCLLKNGQPSTDATTCASGFAIDGVCCDTSCTGTCLACSAALKGSGANGTCGFAAKGSDPRAACPGKTCTGTVQENGHTCDGAGACAVTTTTSCSPYFCNAAGTACLSAVCASDSNCVTTSYCAAGACTPKQALGKTCSAANQCLSGMCVDGVCCDSVCGAICQACTAALKQDHSADGTCGNASADVACLASITACEAGACKSTCSSDSDCATGFGCSAGACVPKSTAVLGSPCTDASKCPAGSFCTDGVCCTDAVCSAGFACNTATKKGTCAKAVGVDCKAAAECGTGFCVDGVCCDAACTGQCQACDILGNAGVCSPVVGEAPHGKRAACDSGMGNACAAKTCDGNKDVTICAAFASASTVCSPPSCAAGTLTQEATCDGAGACKTPTTRACAPYACDGATKCGTACVTNKECASGFFCAGGACSAITATCTPDGAQSVPMDGSAAKSCAPYRCDPSTGNCFVQCATSDQCAPGDVCGVGVCQPGAPEAEPSGGCSVQGTGTPSSLGVSASVLLLLSYSLRRRSLRSRPRPR